MIKKLIKKIKNILYLLFQIEEKLWYGKIHRHIFVEEEM